MLQPPRKSQTYYFLKNEIQSDHRTSSRPSTRPTVLDPYSKSVVSKILSNRQNNGQSGRNYKNRLRSIYLIT